MYRVQRGLYGKYVHADRELIQVQEVISCVLSISIESDHALKLCTRNAEWRYM